MCSNLSPQISDLNHQLDAFEDIGQHLNFPPYPARNRLDYNKFGDEKSLLQKEIGFCLHFLDNGAFLENWRKHEVVLVRFADLKERLIKIADHLG